jgi:hypothetical protein
MDGHSSVPLIARGLARLLAQTLCGTLPNVLADLMEHGLALGKDFAVSLPLFCPYGGIGPSSSGSGPPGVFTLGRHCSHLCSCEWRLLAATFLSLLAQRECPDFPLSYDSNRLDYQPHYHTLPIKN